jgi:hypothetical protein
MIITNVIGIEGPRRRSAKYTYWRGVQVELQTDSVGCHVWRKLQPITNWFRSEDLCIEVIQELASSAGFSGVIIVRPNVKTETCETGRGRYGIAST